MENREHWQALSAVNTMSFLKMAIRRVSTIRLEMRKYTAFLQANPCKAPEALPNTLWGQQGFGVGLGWALSLSCH